jgi:hypothetical protein
MSRNLGALTLLDPSGPAWPVMGVLYLYLLVVMELGHPEVSVVGSPGFFCRLDNYRGSDAYY